MDSLDQDVLDRLVRDMGGEAAVTRILSMYVGKLPHEVASLTSSATVENLTGLAEGAHRLKSSTAMLGATRLAGLLEELEQAARAENDKIWNWLIEIEAEEPRVEAAMRARIAA